MTIAYLITAFTVAFFIGQIVTYNLVERGGWWAQPIVPGFVRANLPVGGLLAAGAMLFVPEAAVPFLGAVSLGFTASAVGYDA